MRYVVEIDGLRLRNPLNGTHQHWAAKSSARKAQRAAVHLAWVAAGMPRGVKLIDAERQLRVRITRLGKRAMDDDGLAASAKACRDQVAAELGVDDKLRIWSYEQQKSPTYGVRIEVELD